jgi:hypothetical protein
MANKQKVESVYTVKKQRRAYRKMLQSQRALRIYWETLRRMEWHKPLDYDLGATQLVQFFF